MKTKTPFLDFYYKCIEQEDMPSAGLCNSLDDRNPLPRFAPTIYEIENLDVRLGYWGYNGDNELDATVGIEQRAYKFTPLRQTIVLFCAAMNNEL